MSQQLSYVAITIAFDFCEIFMATEAWYTLVSTMTAQKVGQQNSVSTIRLHRIGNYIQSRQSWNEYVKL